MQADLASRLEADWVFLRAGGHPDCRPMTWDQLREMQRGGMEIGSHGVDHRMLAKLSPGRMLDEVRGSKQALERELGVPARVTRTRWADPTPSITIRCRRCARRGSTWRAATWPV